MIGQIVVLITDCDGIIRYAGPNFEPLFGAPTASALGQPLWFRLTEAVSVDRMQAALRTLQDGRQPDDDEGPWRREDGCTTMLHWRYVAERSDTGTITSIVFAGYDIGRVSTLTAELGESLDRYESILSTAVDGIISIDENGSIEVFNHGAERIFGYRAAEVIGRNVSMLMPSPYREEHDGYLLKYRTTRRKQIIGIGREVKGQRRDGTVFPMELAVGEVSASSRRSFTGIVRDISDRKEAEAEARQRLNELAHAQRQRSIGELASGIAHEVTQPLTAIVSTAHACLRMIDDGTADLASIREAQQQIARQGLRAGEVIHRLYRYSERGEPDKAPASLHDSIDHVLKLLWHELQSHDVRTVVSGEPDLPLVSIDLVQIEQVLVNLVRNAIEAMCDDGVSPDELQLASGNCALSGARGIQVDIRDNGPGIAGDPERLFEPFYSTRPGGLGQGLSISRRIIENHGGRIWAETLKPRGARFSFWLPIAEGN